MEGQITNVFDRILLGLKITNDNVVILNEKIDTLLGFLTESGKGNDNDDNSSPGMDVIPKKQ